jgi:hypothetical protein
MPNMSKSCLDFPCIFIFHISLQIFFYWGKIWNIWHQLASVSFCYFGFYFFFFFFFFLREKKELI